MSFFRKENSVFFLFLVLGVLVFFAQTKDFKLMVDGLTYAALAKNILKTGDWKTLHYGLEQYADFYQHPPLAMWLQALIYKILGFSEPISRILPSVCALGTLLCVFSYTRFKSNLTAAYFAGITLLTSTRFVKWGTNYYLDGIFTFFCFSGFTVWLKNIKAEKPSFAFSYVSGILFSFAFMTKGIIVLGPLALIVASVFLLFNVQTLKHLFVFSLGLATPLALWICAGDGAHYLDQYFHQSVLSRMGLQELNRNPWRNIFFLWWPWWPIFLWSCFKFYPFDREKLLFTLAALSFPLGFTLSNVYLEHYLTPFYPFAAVLVGIQISQWVPALTESWIEKTWALALILALFLATFSPSVNPMKEAPVHEWIYELEHLSASAKSEVHQVVFTDESVDLWYGLANILGKTPWQSIGKYALDRKPIPQSILVAKEGQKPDPAWQIAHCLQVRGYQFYTSPDLNVCSQ